MKKRFLATILAVVMVAGICVNTGAETDVIGVAYPSLAPDGNVVYEEDFEGSSAPMGEKFTVIGDPSDPTDNVLAYTDTSWGTAVSEPLIKDCNPAQVYTIQFKIYGDVSVLGLVFNHEQWSRVPVSNGADTQINIVGVETTDPNTGEVTSSLLYNRLLKNEWNTYVATFSGHDQYRFAIMTQSKWGVNGGTVLFDDIKIYTGDMVEALTPTPTPDSTVTPTHTPTEKPTPSPTQKITKPNYGGDFEYILKNNDEVEITKYIGSKSFVDIPGKIINRKVTSIGDSAFKGNEIVQSVIFPDTLEEIGKQAFESCVLLNNVSFKENLKTIGWSAFLNCPSLSMVIIPQSVNNIGEYAFGYENSYKKVLGFTISGFSNTAAEEYATDNGLNFLNLGSSTNEKKSVKFTKKSVKIKKGKKVTLKVKITGAKKATFTTSKKKVVKIVKKKAKKVVIKGLRKGKAVITAKAAGKKAKCKVTVR